MLPHKVANAAPAATPAIRNDFLIVVPSRPRAQPLGPPREAPTRSEIEQRRAGLGSSRVALNAATPGFTRCLSNH